MPPKARVTREKIIEAGFEIVREEGAESLSVRNVAGRLGCSTQPVMYNFSTVEELVTAALARAGEFRLSYIMPEGSGSRSPVAWGVDHIQFAARERNVFRFLFQSGRFDARQKRVPEEERVIETLAKDKDIGPASAEAVFFRLFAAAHGMASLVANGAADFDEKLCIAYLEEVMRGLRTSGDTEKKESAKTADRPHGKGKEKDRGRSRDKDKEKEKEKDREKDKKGKKKK